MSSKTSSESPRLRPRRRIRGGGKVTHMLSELPQMKKRWMKFVRKTHASETKDSFEASEKAKGFGQRWHWLMDYLSETNRVGVRMDRERAAVLAGHVEPWLSYVLRSISTCLVLKMSEPHWVQKRVAVNPKYPEDKFLEVKTLPELQRLVRAALESYSGRFFHDRLSDAFIDWVLATARKEDCVSPKRKRGMEGVHAVKLPKGDAFYVNQRTVTERPTLAHYFSVHFGDTSQMDATNKILRVNMHLLHWLYSAVASIAETMCDAWLTKFATEHGVDDPAEATVRNLFEAWTAMFDALFGDVSAAKLVRDPITEGIQTDLDL